MSLRIVSAVVVLLLAAATPAAGREVIRTDDEGMAAPQLVGDEVVFGSQAADGSPQIRALRVGGKRSRLIRSFSPLGPRTGRPGYPVLRFAASTNVLVVAYTVITGSAPVIFNEDAPPEFGPVEGPWRPVECSSPHYLVDGARAAFECHEGERSWVRVVNAVTGAELVRLDPPAGTSEVRLLGLAGDYVAYRVIGPTAPNEYVVRSLSRRREVYRVPGGPDPSTGVALDRDGTLVRVSRVEGALCADTAWFSPAEPRPHHVAGCITGDFRVSGGNVVAAMTINGVKGLGVTALRDDDVRLIPGDIWTFDLQGNRIVYGCLYEPGIFVEEVDEKGTRCKFAPLPDRPGPPPEVAAKRVRAIRDGVVAVPISCPDKTKVTVRLIQGDPASGVSSTRRVVAGPGERLGIAKVKLRRRVPRAGLLVRVEVAWVDTTRRGDVREYPLRVLPARR